MTCKPEVTVPRLEGDMKSLYGLTVTEVKELQSYDDAMFTFNTHENERYIAKYYNPLYTTEDILSKILEVLVHLKKLNVPRPVPQLSGNMLSRIEDEKNQGLAGYLVVYNYISGISLCSQTKDPSFWRKLGKMVAEISERMSEVECENYVRHHNWDPLNAHKTLEEVRKYFPGDRIPNVNVDSVIASLKTIETDLKDIPKRLQHTDVNEYNIILGEDDEMWIIDFNDLILSYRVFDLGHFIGYMTCAQHCNLKTGGYVFEGYSSVIKLSDKELNMLYDVVIARFTLSVSIGCQTILSGGANDYVKKCVDNNIVYLQKLTNFGRETFNKVVIGI
ncbi:hydroxylysine kinase-like [Bolinopsis microptera]|uniref:hydroxylysine kinase-like n=1 Tax=Bolinopsis microptera TaxID=2820187 RepID=UPI003078D078